MSAAGRFARLGTPSRVAGFVLGLGALFGGALAIGAAVGPSAAKVADAGSSTGHGTGHGTGGSGSATSSPSASMSGGASMPGGLRVAQDGYALRLGATRATAGTAVPMWFTVTGPGGAPVTAFDMQHEKRLHLIAVRRDQSGFQHVHPTLAADGTWSTTLDLTPGTWRLFADFKASGGTPLTLGSDLSVAGAFEPVPAAAPSRTAVVDGYTVTLTGDLVAGRDARLGLTVTKDGRPVTDLDPYLGAYGHLVALRDGDLAYLHVHPDGEPGDGRTTAGPEVVFHTPVPTAGGYRLHLDFQHQGVVRTASFVVAASEAPDAAPASTPAPEPTQTGDSDGHGH
ncbi:hypothetical protein [Terrabacter terrigena]|uniref:Secreted protein n=1 Tax=Terrabacter terrigena TaxID=574718 RepID=A0ABW3N3I8_9MICO